MLQTLTLEKPASKIFSNFGVKISKTKSALPHNISQSRPCFSHVLKSVCHSRVCAAVSIAITPLRFFDRRSVPTLNWAPLKSRPRNARRPSVL